MKKGRPSEHFRMFAIDLLAPAFGILRPFERTNYFVRGLYVGIPILIVAAWYRIVSVTALFTPDDFGFFLLLVGLPFLICLYYLLWVKRLFAIVRMWPQLMSNLQTYILRMCITLIPAFVLASWVFIMFGGNFVLYEIQAMNIIAIFGFLILIFSANAISAIYAPQNQKRLGLVASFFPVIGIQGAPFFFRGDYAKGLICLLCGCILVALVAYGQINASREFRFWVNLISYFSVWLYMLIWFYVLAYLEQDKTVSGMKLTLDNGHRSKNPGYER